MGKFKKMRAIIIILLLFSTKLFGQIPTESEVEKYVKTVDSLKNKNQLQKFFYPNMSYCGGALYGYYYQNKLVYIDAVYGGEFRNFSSRVVYFKDTIVYKIIYRQVLADWDKFIQKYPEASEKLMERKMTYTDTTFTIIPTVPAVHIITANKKTVSKDIDSQFINQLLSCGKEMKKELETEKTSP